MEQQQEQPEGLEEMKPFWMACGFLLLPLIFISCGESHPRDFTLVADSTRHSWVGESESGLRVLCEFLPKPHFPSEVRHTEEEVLRSRLGFGNEMALLRVHLIGPSELLSDVGQLVFQGNSFHGFEYIPENLSASDKLLWISVIQGNIDIGVPLGPSGYRSFLLWGEVLPTDPSVRLLWKGSNLEIPLDSRSWDENQRGRFLYSSPSSP